MTSIRYRRLAFALIGVNASLLGLRYYNKGSVSGLSGNETSWAGRNGNWASRRTEEEEALQAQRSELLRRFRGESALLSLADSAQLVYLSLMSKHNSVLEFAKITILPQNICCNMACRNSPLTLQTHVSPNPRRRLWTY